MTLEHIAGRQLAAAERISLVLFQTTSVDELVEKALAAALEEVEAEAGSVLLADTEKQELVFHYSIGAGHVPIGTAFAWDRGIAGRVFQTGTALVIPNVKQHADHFRGIDDATGFITRDMITLPLRRWRGDPLGVLNVLNKRSGHFNDDDLAILTVISAFTALAIEQSLLQEKARLAELVGLLGNLSHDVKNMVSVVVSVGEILRRDMSAHLALPSPGADESNPLNRYNRMLDLQQKSSLRIQGWMKEIVDCVKGLSSPPDFASCKLHAVVESVFDVLRQVAEARKITLMCSGLDRLDPIIGDESRLFNAFYNLINNAIPELEDGGAVIVRGAPDHEAREVVITVEDNGKGMTPEVRDAIFGDRFVTTKKDGTGLGTKIVRDIVLAHKGTIEVESELGVGTRFLLRLPFDPAVNEEEMLRESIKFRAIRPTI